MVSSASARPLFLVGFMATGKSTVGRLVAHLLGMRFIDLDERIERAASTAVRDIFTAEGEAGFRKREAAALNEVLAGPPAVVATGGGTPCFGDNLARMRSAGLVVALTASHDCWRERAAKAAAVRPLLERPQEEVQALYRDRMPWYRQSHAVVVTDGVTPEAVARRIARIAAGAGAAIATESLPQACIVATADAPYPVLIARGSLVEVGATIRRVVGSSVARIGLISDDNVAPLYGERVRAALHAVGFAVVSATVAAGEAAKNVGEFANLCNAMVAGGLDRSSAIVALGGGVVGDLAGFVAASLYRGIRCIQVPTTLLAMVDSAIGGKTGVNIAAGKNLVGAFWQPSLVLADPKVLQTLPVRERRAAYGELVKYALLDGEELYAKVDALASWIAEPALDRDAAVPVELTEVIHRAAAIKSWIVTRDEREQSGERALLNLGHTVGHAIEAATQYQRYLHGEAVALGLLAAARVSAHQTLCDADLEQRIARTLQRAGLDTKLTPWLSDEVLAYIGVDKKRSGTQLRFITMQDVGVVGSTLIEQRELLQILRC